MQTKLLIQSIAQRNKMPLKVSYIFVDALPSIVSNPNDGIYHCTSNWLLKINKQLNHNQKWQHHYQKQAKT